MLPAPAAKRPPLLWPVSAEPPAPPWVWMVPGAAGLVRAAGLPPPPLLLPPPPPAALLPAAPGWPVPCEPLLLPEPRAAARPPPLLHGQWIFGAHSPVIGFSPSSSVEFVPVFPPVYASAVPPHAGKSWVDKRLPNCKIYLNNAFALDSAWIHPEESRIFQGNEKPLLMTNQVAMAIARPAAASRPLPTVVLAPQLIPGGCQNSLKPVGGNQTIALAAAAAAATTAVVSVDSETPQGPSATSVQPCHVLTLSPIKIPVLTSPFPGSASRMDAHVNPLMPAQVARVTAVSAPAVTFMATNLMDQTLAADKSVSSCPGDENDDLSIKTKRNKTEDSQIADQGKDDAEERDVSTSAHQIVLPLEERITHFRDMLLERGVSAFSTWEKELHKIVFDPRYLLLNSEERKQIFEQFVKTRIREEYKEKKNKLLLAKEEFKKLLEESKLSPRTTFKEFAEKYGRDQRFRLVQKKKDQEHFFNQFILILKKRDKENRIRLRKMR
ncbi:transcription elongation regulator 1-like protein isoform X3 [Dromaius novaehollandiae]|uniref:transcription elongation regulator 1-like protein isoform X3 n=1 Tax=Dromaius novaehollandiae TaxID=8790 RepID=UPI00311FC7BF